MKPLKNTSETSRQRNSCSIVLIILKLLYKAALFLFLCLHAAKVATSSAVMRLRSYLKHATHLQLARIWNPACSDQWKLFGWKVRGDGDLREPLGGQRHGRRCTACSLRLDRRQSEARGNEVRPCWSDLATTGELLGCQQGSESSSLGSVSSHTQTHTHTWLWLGGVSGWFKGGTANVAAMKGSDLTQSKTQWERNNPFFCSLIGFKGAFKHFQLKAWYVIKGTTFWFLFSCS